LNMWHLLIKKEQLTREMANFLALTLTFMLSR